jgi:hypothetical protein
MEVMILAIKSRQRENYMTMLIELRSIHTGCVTCSRHAGGDFKVAGVSGLRSFHGKWYW